MKGSTKYFYIFIIFLLFSCNSNEFILIRENNVEFELPIGFEKSMDKIDNEYWSYLNYLNSDSSIYISIKYQDFFDTTSKNCGFKSKNELYNNLKQELLQQNPSVRIIDSIEDKEFFRIWMEYQFSPSGNNVYNLKGLNMFWCDQGYSNKLIYCEYVFDSKRVKNDEINILKAKMIFNSIKIIN